MDVVIDDLTEAEQQAKPCLPSKLIEDVVEGEGFQQLIIYIILLNTLFLASEFYDEPEYYKNITNIGNVVFTAIFAFEMVFKLMGLGFKKYMNDPFNIFDCLIVLMSLAELVLPGESSGLSVLRAFRLLRIFKIIKSWKTLRVLLSTVLDSIGAITNLGVLTFLFLFIAGLLGKQFYNQQLYDEDGKKSRYSFQSTADSLITIFIVLTGENWNEIMVQVMSSTESYTPSIYFITCTIFGNYMLLNLFLAILLKFITESDEHEKQEEAKVIENLPKAEPKISVSSSSQRYSI